jgi:hypothetical protein
MPRKSRAQWTDFPRAIRPINISYSPYKIKFLRDTSSVCEKLGVGRCIFFPPWRSVTDSMLWMVGAHVFSANSKSD